MMLSIPWESLVSDLNASVPSEIKIHLQPIVDKLQASSKDELEQLVNTIEKSLLLVEACLDRTWEMLNSGHWKNVPVEYRYSYSLCIIVKVVLLEIQYEITEKKESKKANVWKEILLQVDKGILLGAPLPNASFLLTQIASKINDRCRECSETSAEKNIVVDDIEICDTVLPGFTAVKRYKTPSLESFYTHVFNPKVPAVLQDCINHWNALKAWRDINYLTKLAGWRTVPIEIGSRYTEDDWSQHLVTLSTFIQEYIGGNSGKVGYLAQHQLFEQIPELKNDFSIPDYCSFSDKDESENPEINAWFGPSGTVSPLHFDPKNNLLCQVFGYKRIILYPPHDTVNLYPYESKLLNNTAQVDPMNPCYEKWPNFRKAEGNMCFLRPGEILYIPPTWWHHVTALTPSFSISFWWI